MMKSLSRDRITHNLFRASNDGDVVGLLNSQMTCNASEDQTAERVRLLDVRETHTFGERCHGRVQARSVRLNKACTRLLPIVLQLCLHYRAMSRTVLADGRTDIRLRCSHHYTLQYHTR